MTIGTFQSIDTIASLRLFSTLVSEPYAFDVQGYSSIGDGGGGIFDLVSSDTASGDDGGTIIVDSIGRRWRRAFSGPLNPLWFGVSTSSSDNSAAILACQAASSKNILWPPGTYATNSVTLTGAQAFSQGASLSIPVGQTLTVAGTISAGRYQIFTGWTDGSIPVEAQSSDVNRILFQTRQDFYPEWWGAMGNGTSNDKPAWQRMFYSFPNLTTQPGYTGTSRVSCNPGATYLFGSGGLYDASEYSTSPARTSNCLCKDVVNLEIDLNGALLMLDDCTEYAMIVAYASSVGGVTSTTTSSTFTIAAPGATQTVPVTSSAPFLVSETIVISAATNNITGTISAVSSGSLSVTTTVITSGAAGNTMASGAAVTLSRATSSAFTIAGPGSAQTIPVTSSASFVVKETIVISDGTNNITGTISAISSGSLSVTTTAIASGAAGNTMASGAAVTLSISTTLGKFRIANGRLDGNRAGNCSQYNTQVQGGGLVWAQQAITVNGATAGDQITIVPPSYLPPFVIALSNTVPPVVGTDAVTAANIVSYINSNFSQCGVTATITNPTSNPNIITLSASNGGSVTASYWVGAYGNSVALSVSNSSHLDISGKTTTNGTFVVAAVNSSQSIPVTSSSAFVVGTSINVSDGTHSISVLITGVAGGILTATTIAITSGAAGDTMASGALVFGHLDISGTTTTSGTFVVAAVNSSQSIPVTSSAPFVAGTSISVSDGIHSISALITGVATGTLTATTMAITSGAAGNTMASGAAIFGVSKALVNGSSGSGSTNGKGWGALVKPFGYDRVEAENLEITNQIHTGVNAYQCGTFFVSNIKSYGGFPMTFGVHGDQDFVVKMQKNLTGRMEVSNVDIQDGSIGVGLVTDLNGTDPLATSHTEFLGVNIRTLNCAQQGIHIETAEKVELTNYTDEVNTVQAPNIIFGGVSFFVNSRRTPSISSCSVSNGNHVNTKLYVATEGGNTENARGSRVSASGVFVRKNMNLLPLEPIIQLPPGGGAFATNCDVFGTSTTPVNAVALICSDAVRCTLNYTQGAQITNLFDGTVLNTTGTAILFSGPNAEFRGLIDTTTSGCALINSAASLTVHGTIQNTQQNCVNAQNTGPYLRISPTARFRNFGIDNTQIDSRRAALGGGSSGVQTAELTVMDCAEFINDGTVMNASNQPINTQITRNRTDIGRIVTMGMQSSVLSVGSSVLEVAPRRDSVTITGDGANIYGCAQVVVNFTGAMTQLSGAPNTGQFTMRFAAAPSSISGTGTVVGKSFRFSDGSTSWSPTIGTTCLVACGGTYLVISKAN